MVVACLMALNLVVAGAAFGQPVSTWIGQTNNWFGNNNWVNGAVPTAGSIVAFSIIAPTTTTPPGAVIVAVPAIPGGAVGGTIFIGFRTGEQGMLTVTGPGAMLTTSFTPPATPTNNGNIYVGFGGTGTFNVLNGAVVKTAGEIVLGDLYGTTPGTGTVNIQNGGTIVAPSVDIALSPASTGTLNIGAPSGSPPVAPGTLQTPTVEFGSGSGTINFNHTATDTNPDVFTPVISGTGMVNVISGTTVFPNDNDYEGTTNITGGSLVIGAPDALGSSDVFLTGGTLRTTSSQTGVPLTINVGANYTQGAGGTLELQIGGLNGSRYDHVQVAGNASLNGTLAVSSLNGFHPSNGNAFEVLHANGRVRGNFSSLNDSAFNTTPGTITGHLELRPIEVIGKNAVVLVYVAPPPDEELPKPPGVQPPIVDDPGVTLPPVNPDEPISEPEVVQLVDPTAEELTSLYQIGFSAADMQRFNLGDRMFQIQQSAVPPQPVTELAPPTTKENEGKGLEGKAPPPAPPPSPINRWGVWASSWGDFVNLDSTSAALGYRFTTFGISAGVDYLIIPNHFAVGLFGGYSHAWINFTPSGSATANTGRGGLYATYFNQGWWVNVAGWGGGTNYSTSRQALVGTANGETSGWEASTFGETGYDFHWNDLSFGPTVAMQYTNVHLNGFGENGSLIPLNIHGDSQDSLVTDVGGRAYYKWLMGHIPVIPRVQLAWEHEYLYSNLPLIISAPALDGATTTVFGPNVGHDSLIINAGVSVQWTPRIWTTIGYDGQVARDHYNSNAVTGTLSFTF